MKILKMRNGIALVAVMTIMLVTTLFIPVMFSMSDTSLAIALKGTDRQRSSYLARTITEMTVAAFKSFDSTDITTISGEELNQYNRINAEYQKLISKTISEIKTEEVAMFATTKEGTLYYKHVTNAAGTFTTEISEKEYTELQIYYEKMVKDEGKDPGFTLSSETGTVEDIVYANVGSSEYNTYIADVNYSYIGKGSCTITYDDSVKYYQTDTATQLVHEITETQYNTQIEAIKNSLSTGGTPSFSLSVVENKNITFTSSATVRESTSERSCLLVLQTYPSDEEWLVFGVGGTMGENTGGNQVFVDPTKATGLVPIDYKHLGDASNTYVKQMMLVYSSVGNMIIEPTIYKDGNGASHSSGVNNSQLVLGIQPGLNTTPNNDPSYRIIDGVNYASSIDNAQMNNFVAFAATGAIQVDMPVNLLLNPCRANRLGDGGEDNGSLFKVMIFQAPTIKFNERIDMMMSFYQRSNESARRMSSIVLAAPESTPYSYYNSQRKADGSILTTEDVSAGTQGGCNVKAGMVYFEQDCYLWIIPWGDDGSSSSWLGNLAETVYERDSDFTKIKIASKGDVYYFNSDIKVDGERTGFSLTGYFLETEYIPKMEQYENGDKKWWNLWTNTKWSLASSSAQEAAAEKPTYVKDDFMFVGNIENGDNIIAPEIDDYYTVWMS